jgi:hypothetical protein
MIITTSNKIRTLPEVFPPKVDLVAAKKDKHFLLSFHFVGTYLRSEGLQGVLCYDFLLVGILTIELKT